MGRGLIVFAGSRVLGLQGRRVLHTFPATGSHKLCRMWFESGWVRAVISAIPLLREWLQAEAKPEPIETAFVQGGTAFLEIENRGETADFTAQIVKAVN